MRFWHFAHLGVRVGPDDFDHVLAATNVRQSAQRSATSDCAGRHCRFNGTLARVAQLANSSPLSHSAQPLLSHTSFLQLGPHEVGPLESLSPPDGFLFSDDLEEVESVPQLAGPLPSHD